MSLIRLEDIGKTYQSRAAQVLALQNVNLEAEFGEFVCLLGVSGCGKSTLLQIVAGLEPPSTGRVTLNGEPILGPHRDASVVFQEHGLFPWMTARTNIAFNLMDRYTHYHRIGCGILGSIYCPKLRIRRDFCII